jgi:hypothetical protein
MIVANRKIVKTELVEIVIPASNTLSKIQFPDVPDLRNTHLWNLETYSSQITPLSIISQGQPLVDFTILQRTFITLQSYNGKQFVDRQPLVDFIYNTSAPFQFNPENFIGQRVNYPKSFIQFSDLAIFAGLPQQSIIFKVGYSSSMQIMKDQDLFTTFKGKK